MIAEAKHLDGPEPAAADLDRGPHARGRERLWVATRAVRPLSELIRFVVGPQGEAVADVRCKLPGRGIWVTATRASLNDAIKRKAFTRGFKREVRLPADLVARTEQLLEQSALDALAIAGKAGLVAAGFTKTEAALAHAEVVALLHAVEARPDGMRKLDAAAQRRNAGRPAVTVGFLTSAQLDLALNRPNVIHAALLAGPVSETFLARCRRLERFRTGDQHNQAGNAGPDLSRPRI
jgi:predicted RNA-binding protein YlxR (DUF448 family)